MVVKLNRDDVKGIIIDILYELGIIDESTNMEHVMINKTTMNDVLLRGKDILDRVNVVEPQQI